MVTLEVVINTFTKSRTQLSIRIFHHCLILKPQPYIHALQYIIQCTYAFLILSLEMLRTNVLSQIIKYDFN